ncbi:WD40 repeat-like protein [Colletotrichum tofieldiae]|uniref:WD40 repeat-like protein n=1 Tax=Colletotrichum tofieldiae TaxID=708197 RepID=A0A166M9J4_9PEZI|nr:WD40 repeat-like protein [Colletotrichum tofieldiae]
MVSSSPVSYAAALLSLFAASGSAQNFTIANGQIFTPGLVILDAPQPGTPLGGENLHVALDVSTNGKMPLPPYAEDSPTKIFNVTMFLSSYATGRNFTITNGTATANNASLGDIMFQEPGSTVKHVNWLWPDCLVGNGQPSSADSDRGAYNISIRQNFRLNGEDHYTIFDVPISVTNSIEDKDGRPSCDALNNALLTEGELNATAANAVGVLFAPGDSTTVEVKSGDGGDNGSDDGLGGAKPEASPGDGLGAGSSLSWRDGAHWLCLVSIGAALML